MSKVHIYCPRQSKSALALVKALDAQRLRRFDGESFWNKGKRIKLSEGDAIICWGSRLPEFDDFKILNPKAENKSAFHVASVMARAGISGFRVIDAREVYSADDYRNAGYLPRAQGHKGGLDLLTIDRKSPILYWSQKVEFSREIRIHSFCSKTILVGKKIPRPNFIETTIEKWRPESGLTHPWVRTWEGGWMVSYEGYKPTPQERNLAHVAVKALGFKFGVVDIGIRTPDERPIIIGVSSIPILNDTTIPIYTKAITKWIERTEIVEEDPQQDERDEQ